MKICDRDRIRTCDRLLRRQMLYPAELRDPLKSKKGKPFLSFAKLGAKIALFVKSIKLKFKIFTILDQTDFFAKHSIFLGLEECNPLYFYLLNGSFFMAPKS